MLPLSLFATLLRGSMRMFFAAFLFVATIPFLCALDWLPITDEDREAVASMIDPDAGAEILHRVKQIDDSGRRGVTDEYIRIKVYNEKGVRELSKIDVPYDEKTERIRSIEARVIKPDGTIINVDKKDFYDREIIKYGNLRVRVRSFSFPLVEPGMIVEYKWRRRATENIIALKLDFMSEMPTRRVLFRIKPQPLPPGFRTMGFFRHCGEHKLQRGKDGFAFIEMTDLKAAGTEPYMPLAADVHPWMVFYPTYGSPSMHWSFISRGLAAIVEETTKRNNKLVNETAAAITKGLDMPEDRLAAINDYCRIQIKNTDHDTQPGEQESSRRNKGPRKPADVIKAKSGDTLEINILFIALAKAIGQDVKLALSARKTNGAFLKDMPSIRQLPDPLVAAHIMDTWHFYDPAHRDVSTGMLHWVNESQVVMIPRERGFRWQVTPMSPVEKSPVKRTARLRLDAEGGIEGDVSITLSGHPACDARERFRSETQNRVEEIIRESVQARFPNAELSGAAIANLDDATKPFVITYNVRVPAYAERAGQRLFFQPGFFSKGRDARFTAESRAYDIRFNYPSLDEDDVVIALPAGYKIEEGSAPKVVDRTKWGRYSIEIALNRTKNTIIYNRIFEFLPVHMPAAKYSDVKRIFDFVHLQDSHTLTIRAGE
ncbi:DUF3857 and transglutaminase domain-containing protein [Ereboglobus luteus]|uniref:DUF3857 domain-containing protein n=1 Tax=Ereboglobus luteus TaxID=1796921 RepID=A0A2U8E4C4_9BACT|nr:DUF3857 and transglutaminase domain-containing protein [Ereboglobus luteus]AWI09788.1 hypothetical protein CKA38_11490 [Ereboglobus luteus]